MSLTELCFWPLYVGGLCTAIVYPLVGVLLYILVYHLNPEYQWWGESVRASGLRTSMTIAAATVVGILLRRPRFDGCGRQFPLPVIAMIALALYAVTSLGWGPAASERGLYQAEKFVKILIFVLLLIRCVRQPKHYHLVILAWLLGTLYVGYQAWGNVGIHHGGRLAWGIGGPDFAESSDLAAHLIATLPFVGALFFMSRGWLGRWFALITGALVVNTIVLTRTRNAIIGLAAMSIAAVFSLPKGYRLKGWAAIALGAVLAAQLVDPGWWHRMSTITQYRADAAAMGRLDYWQAAVEMARDHPLGIGIGNFHERVREYVPGLEIERSTHNTYLECLAELGVPGFALLVAIIVMSLVRLSRIRRASQRFTSDITISVGLWETRFHLGWHAMALRAGLIGYLACGMFTTRLWAEDFWILLGLAACLTHVSKHMRAHRHAATLLPASPVADGARRRGRSCARPQAQPSGSIPGVEPDG